MALLKEVHKKYKKKKTHVLIPVGYSGEFL